MPPITPNVGYCSAAPWTANPPMQDNPEQQLMKGVEPLSCPRIVLTALYNITTFAGPTDLG
jgi:hypothetical protein